MQRLRNKDQIIDAASLVGNKETKGINKDKWSKEHRNVQVCYDEITSFARGNPIIKKQSRKIANIALRKTAKGLTE